MFTKLIESKSQFIRHDITTAASIAIHLILIVVAAYFTTAKAIHDQEQEQGQPLHWINTLPLAHNAKPGHTQRAAPSSTTRPVAEAPQFSFAIDANIPSLDVELASVKGDNEFGGGVTGSPSDGPTGLSSDPSQAFDAREVDTPVSVLSSQPAPLYPPALRAAGIEGRVIAQFIVDSKGKAVLESIRIVSSTNDLFSESVTKAIRQMRFTPARIGNTAVSQVVQQLFVFRLDR